jgi:prevent-host-death family protein
MELVQHIPKTELARNTRQVIRAAQRGQTVVIESHGQPEVAIMDISDFYIMRAVLRYYAESSANIGDTGWDEQAWQTAVTPQARFDLVLAQYLNEHISLGKAAELLELAWLDLRTRLVRLNVPLRIGPVNLDEARQDVANLAALLASNNP